MLTFILLVFAVFVVIYCWYARPKDAPPGPRGIPIFGIMPFLDDHPERMFAKWSEKYGPVMTVPMGPQNWIVLNDYASVHEVLG